MSPRRIKTYTAQTGYVYEYYFVGKRAALAAPGKTEYIFDVSNDRKVTFSVSVFVAADAVSAWSSAHGRSLSDAEQYAAVKMRLLRGFDEIADMLRDGRSLNLDTDATEEFLSDLGIE